MSQFVIVTIIALNKIIPVLWIELYSLKKCWSPNSQDLPQWPYLVTVSLQMVNLRWGHSVHFSSVQSLSCVQLFVTPWTAAHQASLSITNSQSLPKLMYIELVIPSNRLILCHPLLLLPSIFPSILVFSNESTLYQVAKVLEFQLQHQSFQWTPWTNLLSIWGALKSLHQHHS